MVQQTKTEQPELLLQAGDDDRENQLVLETEQEAIADLPQDKLPLQKPKKTKRSLLRWIVYGGLGFGILAIALPAFLGQTVGCGGNKARNAEGKTYVGSMNRAQQAFWLEKSAFAKSIPALDMGISEETSNFKYKIQRLPLVSYQYAIPKNDKVKGFVGAVFVIVPEDNQTEKKEITTVTILCESQGTGLQEKLSKPSLQNGKPTCAEGTLSLN